MPLPELPDLLEYDNYRIFLADWFRTMQARDPSYTHRRFVEEAGLTNRGILLLVISGERRLTHALQASFALPLRLDHIQAEYLEALTEVEEAEIEVDRATRRLAGVNEKKKAGAVRRVSTGQSAALTAIEEALERKERAEQRARALRVQARVREGTRTIPAGGLVPMALNAVTRCQGVGWDPKAAAAALTLGVTASKAEEILARLQPGNDYVTPAEVAVEEEVKAYYREVSAASARAVEAQLTGQIASDQARLGGVTLAVPLSVLPALHQRLYEQQAEIYALLSALPSDEPGDLVVQVFYHLFPLSVPQRRGTEKT